MTKTEFAIGGFINKLRIIQGYNLLTPEQTRPTIEVWREQLERLGINPSAYQEIINAAIDHRRGFISRGENPPAMSIELILTKFEELRTANRTKRKDLTRNIDYLTFQVAEAEKYIEFKYVPDQPIEFPGGRTLEPRTEKQQRLEFEFRRDDFLRTHNRHKSEGEEDGIPALIERFTNRITIDKANLEALGKWNS